MPDYEYLQRQIDHLEDEVTFLRQEIRDILYEISLLKEELNHDN